MSIKFLGVQPNIEEKYEIFADLLGFDEETYFENMDEGDIEYNKDSMKELFETNIAEIKLSNNQFYMVSDEWLRGTRIVISEGELIGTVLGYLN